MPAVNDILGPSDQGVKSPPTDAPSTELARLPWDQFGVILKAISPDDPTGHIANCGYTDEEGVCDCANVGRRLITALAEVIKAERADERERMMTPWHVLRRVAQTMPHNPEAVRWLRVQADGWEASGVVAAPASGATGAALDLRNAAASASAARACAWDEGARAVWEPLAAHAWSLDYYLEDNPYRPDPPASDAAGGWR